MNPNSFALLYNDFIEAAKAPDTMIDFYHKNALFLNNIKHIDNKDDLQSYIQIINRYVNALYEKKRFSKVIELINDRLPFIDEEIIRLDAPETKQNEWYYYILFYKAASLNSTRNYKAAHPVFFELTEIDPENELFKNWLKHTDFGLNMWILRAIAILSVVLVVGGLVIFGWLIPNRRLYTLLPNIGLLLGFGSFACELYLKRKFKV